MPGASLREKQFRTAFSRFLSFTANHSPASIARMRTVRVSLGDRSYNIHVGNGLLPRLGEYCRQSKLGERCAVITDSNVAPHYADATIRALRQGGFVPKMVTIPAGEGSKSLKIVAECYDQLAAHRLERRSFVIALGGGVVGDLAGYVAATYLRGISLVQVPTTLLSQVDSSVGGKVGINLKAGKNLVGAFHQPKVVVCDLDTLSTLPAREYRAGFGEVIKYGLIKDAELFGRLEKELDDLLKRNPSKLINVVARCCAIKAEIVAADETENSLRKILNFGHTIGHAIETVFGYDKFLHGEAISIGQVAAAHLSARLTELDPKSVSRLRELLERAGLPVSVNLSPKQRDALFDAMRLDKKVTAGEVKFVLASRIGEVVWDRKASDAEIRGALDAVKPAA